MLKASWGGGGRGMRVIESDAQLTETAARRAPRSQGRLRQRRGLSREAGAQGAAHRSADPRRHARQPRAPVRARLHRAAAQPESGRARARGVPHRRAARRAVRATRCRSAARCNYLNAGTVEFLQDADDRQVLLHRGESAHPGRAHGDRGRDRHRPREGADPHRRRREDRRRRERRAARRKTSTSRRTRCSAA